MRTVACKELSASEGKVVVVGTTCPFCGRALSEHKEVEDVPEVHKVHTIEAKEVGTDGAVVHKAKRERAA